MLKALKAGRIYFENNTSKILLFLKIFKCLSIIREMIGEQVDSMTGLTNRINKAP